MGYVYGPYEQEGANELVYRWRVHTADDAAWFFISCSPGSAT